MKYYMSRLPEDELYHHGVKGMKWGVRRKRTAAQEELYRKKMASKDAKKAYNKSYNSAYNYSSRHMISQYTNKAKRAESDRRWNDATDKAKKANQAKTDYTNAKADYKNSAEGRAETAARRKKALKVGIAVAGTVLAAYGAKKLSEARVNKKAIALAQKQMAYSGMDNLAKYSQHIGFSSTPIPRATIPRATIPRARI